MAMLMRLRARMPDAAQWIVLRNAFYNLLGLGIPAIVAIFAIPHLILSLGNEKFGVLTIIWAIVSYFGLFDLGLGRALTQHMASALARGDISEVHKVVGTGSAVMIFLGIVGGVLMLALTPVLSRELTAPTAVDEVAASFLWMAFAIPAIVMTSCYRGILEAAERFALINLIRLPMGIFTFVAPLVVVAYAGPRLDMIACVLAVGRIVACLVHASFALKAVPGRQGHGSFDRQFLPPLIKTGGWLTVSNVVAPLMNYIDRFMLGIVTSGAAVAFYATPQELLLRIGIIPSALATVLFPLFARDSGSRDVGRDWGRLRSYTTLIVVLMLPITVVLLFFAHPILSIWINKEFADNASVILQVMAIAALLSGMAQIPYTMLQAAGRADITGKLHIAELPLYVVLLWTLIWYLGPVGAAIAWAVRIAGDLAALLIINRKVLS